MKEFYIWLLIFLPIAFILIAILRTIFSQIKRAANHSATPNTDHSQGAPPYGQNSGSGRYDGLD